MPAGYHAVNFYGRVLPVDTALDEALNSNMENRSVREIIGGSPICAVAGLLHGGISVAAAGAISSDEISALIGSPEMARIQAAFVLGIAPTVIVGALWGLSRFAPRDLDLLRERAIGMLIGVLLYAVIYMALFIGPRAASALAVFMAGCFGIGSGDPRFAWIVTGGIEFLAGLALLAYLLKGNSFRRSPAEEPQPGKTLDEP
jgi:hypothetical protein